jgi:hypothetical protein
VVVGERYGHMLLLLLAIALSAVLLLFKIFGIFRKQNMGIRKLSGEDFCISASFPIVFTSPLQ